LNKIKVIKRMAYGFRDSDYFFLRQVLASIKKLTCSLVARSAPLTTTRLDWNAVICPVS
jgi:hypothetical protein